jgi:hypothetical protein
MMGDSRATKDVCPQMFWQQVDESLDCLWYRDFHQDGKHDFKHEEFYDADHLNRSGSRRLTDMIITWMNEVSAASK